MRLQRTIKEWQELRDRYYDGETTNSEEEQLADYVFNAQEAQTAEWDAERAVLSYLHTRKKREQAEVNGSNKKNHRMWQSVAAIAIIGIIGYGITTFTSKQDNCWISIDGNRFYSDDLASAQMEQNLELALADFTSVEDELSLMFIE